MMESWEDHEIREQEIQENLERQEGEWRKLEKAADPGFLSGPIADDFCIRVYDENCKCIYDSRKDGDYEQWKSSLPGE
jgi:hypothetical protein|tara:strand:- start:18220 stop:18453 length:234 start_codon:yes stop_codon:yes gene_type:complete